MGNDVRNTKFVPTNEPGLFRVVLVDINGVETPTTTRIRAVVSSEPIEDDEIGPPVPTTNTGIRRNMWLVSLANKLLLPFRYLGWRKAIRRKNNPCSHDIDFRQTINLDGTKTVVEGALVCANCLEEHFLADARRICVACHKPIFAGSWVSERRMAGQDRYVHFETCSGDHWCATIWTGDRVHVIGHGI